MEESDIKAPLYYVMGRKAEVERVLKLLTITPCHYGIACDAEEYRLLLPLVSSIGQAHSTHNAELAGHLSRTSGRPVLIVGEGTELKAVYSTGEEETIC